MSKIEVGSLVIINHTDRPEAAMIAIVIIVDSGRAMARYLSRNTIMEFCIGPINNATQIEDFGVKMQLSEGGNILEVIRVGESVAKYEDGKPRKWQGPPDGETIFAPRLEAAMLLNQCHGIELPEVRAIKILKEKGIKPKDIKEAMNFLNNQ